MIFLFKSPRHGVSRSLEQGDRFAAVAAVNSLGILILYQLLMFVMPYSAAYALAGLSGLVFVNLANPWFGYGKTSRNRWETAANSLFYLGSFIASWGVLFVLTEKAGIVPRLSVFIPLAFAVPFNYLAARHIYRGADAGTIAYLRKNVTALIYGGITSVILAGAASFFFYRQIIGTSIFPWDFRGGYYAQALSWYLEGGFFSPLAWFTHGNFGFPAWAALQDSSWFIPDSIISFFRGPLTLQDVTRLQVFLMFFSGLGTHAICRQLKMGYQTTLIVALTYALSGGYFSNATHLDVFRGYALLPWLVLVLHRDLLRTRWGVPFAALVIFQYAIAVYPGQLISAFYVLAIYVLWQFREAWDEGAAWRYAGTLTLAAFAGLLLSALKWWPVFVSRGLLQPGEEYAQAGISPIKLMTLFFPSHAGGAARYGGHITLMTMFIGPVAISGLLFARRFSRDKLALAAMAGTALMMGSMLFSQSQLFHLLPGTSISRMVILDYRGVFHLPLVLLAGLAIEDWRPTAPRSQVTFLRIAGAAIFFTAIAILGLVLGWSRHYVAMSLLPFLVCVAAIAAMTAHRSARGLWMCTAILVVATVAFVALHAYNLERTWNARVDPSIADKTHEPRPDLLAYRPQRFVLPADILSGQAHWVEKSVRYGDQWDISGFAAFGADNVKRLLPHAALYKAFDDERAVPGRPLLAFMLDRSRVAVFDAAADFNSTVLELDCNGVQCGPRNGASVEMRDFRSDGADYELGVRAPERLVENEIWYPGWNGRLIDEDHPDTTPQLLQAQPFGSYLRSWLIPPGHWRFSTSYVAPGYRTSWWMFWAGVLLLVMAVVVSSARRRWWHSAR